MLHTNALVNVIVKARMWALPLVSSERTSVKEARRKIRGTNSMHWFNVADDIPCDMDVGLRESTTMAQNNGYSLLVRVGESGESTQGSRRDWSRKLVRATMVAGWENKVKGPWINHSCCAVHCNCEYVPTEFVRDRK